MSVLIKLYEGQKNAVMSKFLRRDFSLEENKTAAKRNAFVLLGQKRFIMAASFFLLGDSLQDAV